LVLKLTHRGVLLTHLLSLFFLTLWNELNYLKPEIIIWISVVFLRKDLPLKRPCFPLNRFRETSVFIWKDFNQCVISLFYYHVWILSNNFIFRTFTISSFINLCLIYYSFHISTLKICSVKVLILDFYGQHSSGKCFHVAV